MQVISELNFKLDTLKNNYFSDIQTKSSGKAPFRRHKTLPGQFADSPLPAAISAAVAKGRLDDLQTANLHTAALHPFRPLWQLWQIQLSPFLPA